jgi:hypothetical protein
MQLGGSPFRLILAHGPEARLKATRYLRRQLPLLGLRGAGGGDKTHKLVILAHPGLKWLLLR